MRFGGVEGVELESADFVLVIELDEPECLALGYADSHLYYLRIF